MLSFGANYALFFSEDATLIFFFYERNSKPSDHAACLTLPDTPGRVTVPLFVLAVQVLRRPVQRKARVTLVLDVQVGHPVNHRVTWDLGRRRQVRRRHALYRLEAAVVSVAQALLMRIGAIARPIIGLMVRDFFFWYACRGVVNM